MAVELERPYRTLFKNDGRVHSTEVFDRGIVTGVTVRRKGGNKSMCFKKNTGGFSRRVVCRVAQPMHAKSSRAESSSDWPGPQYGSNEKRGGTGINVTRPRKADRAIRRTLVSIFTAQPFARFDFHFETSVCKSNLSWTF